MAFTNDSSGTNAANGFREAVCINTRRIYDSCGDKDCVRDLQVVFTDTAQAVVDAAVNIKARCAEVVGVYFEVEPVAFNKGFYSVDMTFFFKVSLAAYTAPASAPELVEGLATFSKKAILFGSDASVKTFTTEDAAADCGSGLPIVSVQVIDPMILSCSTNDCPCNNVVQVFNPPAEIAAKFGGCFSGFVPHRSVCITIGLFSIVHLERQVQIMIPIYDFCVPEKECVTAVDDPCELFSRIAFPTDEFFPPRLSDLNCDQ